VWNTQTDRARTDIYGDKIFPPSAEADRKVVEAVAAVATARGVPRAQVALAWLIRKPGVTAPIIGAAKPQHLDDAVAALDLELTAAEMAQLEAPYIPHAITGHE
jgi:aryl-alcohol dehydrogenase-like predicted oxidoreductase